MKQHESPLLRFCCSVHESTTAAPRLDTLEPLKNEISKRYDMKDSFVTPASLPTPTASPSGGHDDTSLRENRVLYVSVLLEPGMTCNRPP